MKKIILIVLVIISCYSHAGLAVFSHFDVRHGLTDKYTRSIIEDRSGYLWVGTSSGLYRFDGISFEKIDTSAISVNIQVQSLLVDDDNSLLIGSAQNGLLRYNSLGVKKIPLQGHERISVHQIIIGHKKQLWLATSSGLFQQHPDDNTFIKTQAPPLAFLNNIPINDIEKLKDKTLAIAVKGQIYLYNQQNNQLDTITLEGIIEYMIFMKISWVYCG